MQKENTQIIRTNHVLKQRRPDVTSEVLQKSLVIYHCPFGISKRCTQEANVLLPLDKCAYI
jgi:hypothetical protein